MENMQRARQQVLEDSDWIHIKKQNFLLSDFHFKSISVNHVISTYETLDFPTKTGSLVLEMFAISKITSKKFFSDLYFVNNHN